MVKKVILSISITFWGVCSFGQKDSLLSRLEYSADFRFRIEHDWNSRKPDGNYRDDRTRLRYRARLGFDFDLSKWATFGMRIRTGNPKKQQDPQMTLGAGYEEFGTIPLGFEKLYFNASTKFGSFWVGKNTFPFVKNNELFWSDNVFPEGAFGAIKYNLSSNLVNEIELRTGHFISTASGKLMQDDGFFQAVQVNATLFNNRLQFFPGLHYFHQMPNIPDGGESFFIDYTVLHAGLSSAFLPNKNLKLELDYYQNLQDYSTEDSILTSFRNQKTGFVAGISYGELKQKGDWTTKLSYAYLERFSTVDFFAQNDWARWDYSSEGSTDGRLTNLQGIEIIFGYVLSDKLSLKAKGYLVEQLVPFGSTRETNNRMRFDLDISF